MKFKKLFPVLFSFFAVSLSTVVLASGKGEKEVSSVNASDTTYVTANGMSLFHNSFNAGYDTVVFILSGDTFTDSTTLSSFLSNNVTINGKTISTWASEQGGISWRTIGDAKKPSLNISQAKSILKKDGTDRFVIAENTVFPNGSVLQGKFDYTCIYYENSGTQANSTFVKTWEAVGETSILKTTFYSYNATASSNYMMITFDHTLPGSYTETESTNILKRRLFINGVSMYDAGNKITVNGWNQGNGEKLFITVNMSLFKKDGTDVMEFRKGIVTPASYETKYDYAAKWLDPSQGLFMNDFSVCKKEELSLKSVSLFQNPTGNGLDWLYINTNNAINTSGYRAQNDDNGLADLSLRTRLLINGKTGNEIGIGSSFSFNFTNANNNTQLLIYIKRSDAGFANGFKYDNTDIITLKADFATNVGTYVASDINYLVVVKNGTHSTVNTANIDAFVKSYMHPEIATSVVDDTGACRGEGGYYALAKTAYSKLTDAEKTAFTYHKSYEAMRTRLNAWATANNEAFDGTQFAPMGSPLFNLFSENSSNYVVMVICIAASVSLIVLIITYKKRKQHI